jgi:hypothetical protein
VATQGEVPQGRPNLEAGDAHQESLMERKLATPRDLLVAKLGHIVKRKRKNFKSHDYEELKKAKPPSFNGKIERGEEAEDWLLGLKKYFRVHDYSKNLKARIAIFNLNGNAKIWWEDLKNVKVISEEELSWKQFEKHFKKKYLLEKYFDEKTKEFYELKMGQLIIEEYVNKFFELLRYVPYIRDEKVKFQRFISGLPQTY